MLLTTTIKTSETVSDAIQRQNIVNEKIIDRAMGAVTDLLCDMEPHSFTQIKQWIELYGIEFNVSAIANMVIDRLELDRRIYQTSCGVYPMFCAIDNDESFYAEMFCTEEDLRDVLCY
jgi:hypothetical protein